MTLIPIGELLMSDKEKQEHLIFKKRKLEADIKTERRKYIRDQYALQLAQIDRQLKEIKPKVKQQNLLDQANRVSLERCFMWEAKAYLIKPMYDKIMENAWKRMKITQEQRLKGK